MCERIGMGKLVLTIFFLLHFLLLLESLETGGKAFDLLRVVAILLIILLEFGKEFLVIRAPLEIPHGDG